MADTFTHIRLGCNVAFTYTEEGGDPEPRKGRFEGLDFGKPTGEAWADTPDQWWMTIYDYDRMAPRTFPLSMVSALTLV